MRKLIFALFALILAFNAYSQERFKDDVIVYGNITVRNDSRYSSSDSSIIPNLYVDSISIDGVVITGESAKKLLETLDPAKITINTTYYISEYPEGNDTTGDGTIGNPWHSIKYALENTPDLFTGGSDITYKVDTGNYVFTGEEVDLFNQKKALQASVAIIEGSYNQVLTSIALTQDATNPFRWNAAGQTWTVDQFKGYYIDYGTTDYFPIQSNGVDYLIIPASSGLTTVNINEPKTYLNYGSENLFIQPSVNDKTLTYQNVILNGTGKLKAGNSTPLGNFNFTESTINCKQFNVENVTINAAIINSSLDGLVVVGSDVKLTYSALNGDGGSGDFSILFKGGQLTGTDIIVDNYDAAVDFESGVNNLSITGVFSLNNLNLGYSLNEGSFLIGTPEHYINTVTNLYNGDQTKNIFASFDESLIIGTPTAWVLNDNGLRVEPKDNYVAYIQGVHEPITDTAYNRVVKFEDGTTMTTASSGGGSSVGALGTLQLSDAAGGFNQSSDLKASSVLSWNGSYLDMNDANRNVLIGNNTGTNVTGFTNIAIGYYVLPNASSGNNIALGDLTGFSMTSGNDNILMGDETGRRLNTQTDNVWIGDHANHGAVGGSFNVGIGSESGEILNGGQYNAFFGHQTGMNLGNSSYNTILGSQAAGWTNNGADIDSCVFIGYRAGYDELESQTFILANQSSGSQAASRASALMFGSFRDDSLSVHGDFNFDGNLYQNGSLVDLSGGGSPSVGVSGDFQFSDGSGGLTNANGVWSGSDVSWSGWSLEIHDGVHENTFLGVGTRNLSSIGAFYNTAIGYNSGLDLSQGDYNTFLGHSSGANVTEGLNNVSIGHSAGFTNLTGDNNVHVGYRSGYTSTGSFNVFLGSQSGEDNTSGQYNVYIGRQAGNSMTTGNYNTMIGDLAGNLATSGTQNTFLGHEAGTDNTGSYNTYLGNRAGYNATTGNENVYIGDNTANTITTGEDNVIVGQGAAQAAGTDVDGCVIIGLDAGRTATGDYNVMIGLNSGNAMTGGVSNTFVGTNTSRFGNNNSATIVGFNAGINLNATTGNVLIGDYTGAENLANGGNTIVGSQAGRYSNALNNTFFGRASGYTATGANNTFIGYNSGYSITTGFGNVFIGNQSGENEITTSNSLFIDNSNTSSPLIRGDFSNDSLAINGELHVTGFISQGVDTTSLSTFTVTKSIVFVDATNNAVSLTLPLAADNLGAQLIIKHVEGANSCTINPGGSETIEDGETSLTLSSNQAYTFVSDGSEWKAIAYYDRSELP